MSQIKLSPSASGTGIFTIESPSSNTNRTISLPDNTGTVLTSATTTGFPAGSVIQVVQATYSTQTTTSAGPVDTGLSASITPTSSSSKILVLVTQEFYILGGGADSGVIFGLYRGATNILSVAGHSIYITNSSSGSELISNWNTNYLDSPATTSSTTYKIQMTATAGGIVYTNWNNNTSIIILMEIAA